MKQFETYRGGLPPGPGIFATAGSIDSRKTDIRIGDVISDPKQRLQGLVIAIGGDVLLYLVSENMADADGNVSWFMPADCRDVLIVGHVYDVLREVARIEAADAKRATTG